ncbi:P2Y purinoceptor 6-like [Trichomycterus rosablanca]|uniref:P2Y purinoceptor 6-like n=1 Tax=Trichomycterus rosablanca TaxID=2290929 RepID=UPI002F35FAE4
MLTLRYDVPGNGNETNITSQVENSLQTNISLPSKILSSLDDIITDCNKNGASTLRLPIQIFILVSALPTNAFLLCLFLKNRKTLSPSEVLGLNLALLCVVYCCSLPLDIAITGIHRFGVFLRISHSFAVLSYFGCPLLLTSMCVERYVAVSHPVLFMRLGRWEYRAACSAIIWLLTLTMAAITFVYLLSNTALALSCIANVLFFIMVVCLLGIVWVLCKNGPGDGKPGEQNDSPIKKRALKNIIAVLVPSTIVYLPLLGLAPFLLILQILAHTGTNTFLCACLQMFSVLPNFGVCIGPFFYIARVRKMLCAGNNKATTTSKLSNKT